MVWTCDADDRRKCCKQKQKGNDQEEVPEPDGYTKLERIQKQEQVIGNKYKKAGSGRIETNGDFSVIVDSYHRKQLKNDDDDVGDDGEIALE